MEQLSLQCDELVSQNQQLVQVVDDTYRCVSELAILVDLPVEVQIHRLATRIPKAREEMTKV